MLFDNIRPAIKTLVQTCLGPGVDVVWRDQTARWVPNPTKSVCKLSLGPSGGKGQPDRVLNYDAAQPLNKEMTETVREYRRFTVKCLLESLDQQDTGTAWNYLETLRLRFSWASSVAALKEVGVAVIAPGGDLVDLSRTVDGRILSAANLDIPMSTIATDTDTANPFGYIATVDIEAAK